MNESTTMILAIPSMAEGGLEAERSGHFGRCDCFTLLRVESGQVEEVRVVENPAHGDGGCLRPVELLASEGVTALVVSGIGGRPLIGFNEAGIDVYFENTLPVVNQVADAVLAGQVGLMEPGSVCGCH